MPDGAVQRHSRGQGLGSHAGPRGRDALPAGPDTRRQSSRLRADAVPLPAADHQRRPIQGHADAAAAVEPGVPPIAGARAGEHRLVRRAVLCAV